MKASKPLSMPAARFKASCLAVLDEVERTGREVVVTKRGRPVARVVPLREQARRPLEGSLVHEAPDAWAPVDLPWGRRA